jgi:hypothetical protein
MLTARVPVPELWTRNSTRPTRSTDQPDASDLLGATSPRLHLQFRLDQTSSRHSGRQSTIASLQSAVSTPCPIPADPPPCRPRPACCQSTVRLNCRRRCSRLEAKFELCWPPLTPPTPSPKSLPAKVQSTKPRELLNAKRARRARFEARRLFPRPFRLQNHVAGLHPV